MENYIVSARKYRPSTFDSVVGQRALTTTLKNAIATGKLAHAYLFCGPRGVGKTTCARIFAKTINFPEQTGDCLYDIGEGQWREEDVTHSYAYLTARALNADCSFISYSAIGLMRSWMNLGFNAQDLYKKGAYLREGGDVYDFSNARKPDFVVVNLGTNDIGLMNGGKGGYVGKITDAEYKQAVKNFINQIRTSYGDPDLKIVWAVGLMGSATYALAQEAIEEMNDDRLYTYKFMPAKDGHREHPCMKQGATAAKALRVFLSREGVTKK